MLIRAHGQDAPLRLLQLWPWYGFAYREWDMDLFVLAPTGVHLLMRAWRWRWQALMPLYTARWYFVDDGGLISGGHFTTPWSRCWKTLEFRRYNATLLRGVEEGRRQEREAQDAHFRAYFKQRFGRDIEDALR